MRSLYNLGVNLGSTLLIWLSTCLLTLLLNALWSLLLALPALYIWNWLMPVIFDLPEISYWQAFGIIILAWLILGNKVTFNTGINRGNE